MKRKDDKLSIACERMDNLALFLDEIVEYYREKDLLVEFDLTKMNVEDILKRKTL